MQPLVEEILDIVRSKDEVIREEGLLLIESISDLQYACGSYSERLNYYSHIPEKYLTIYLFDDEWGKIAHFLSRLFIDDHSEVTNRVIYSLKYFGADALESLLDIMVEAPERLDTEPMKFNSTETCEVGQTIHRLLVDGTCKSRREMMESASGDELKRLLKDTGLSAFLTKLTESQLAEKSDKKHLKKLLLWAESELMWKLTKKEKIKLLKRKNPIPFFKRWAASEDPETAKAGIFWLKCLKDDYGIE